MTDHDPLRNLPPELTDCPTCDLLADMAVEWVLALLEEKP